MNNLFLKPAVRLWFTVTGRAAASRGSAALLQKYLQLADRVDDRAGTRPIRVPAMPGLDEDMRDWSFFMICSHNAIVSRSITAIVASLAEGLEPTGPGAIDPKTGVMPAAECGPAEVAALQQAVAEHLHTVSGLGRLRRTRTKRHPIFGDFDAHFWHCMFRFHLLIHLRQAVWVAGEAGSPAGEKHLETGASGNR